MVIIGLVRYAYVSFTERRMLKQAGLKSIGTESDMILPTTVPVPTPTKRAKTSAGKWPGFAALFWRWLSEGEGTAESKGRRR